MKNISFKDKLTLNERKYILFTIYFSSSSIFTLTFFTMFAIFSQFLPIHTNTMFAIFILPSVMTYLLAMKTSRYEKLVIKERAETRI